MDTAGRMRGAQRDCWSLADVGTGSVRIADGRYLTGMALSSAWCEDARVNPQPILATGWIGTAPTDFWHLAQMHNVALRRSPIG